MKKRPLPSRALRTGFERGFGTLAERRLAGCRPEPAAEPDHAWTRPPRSFEPRGKVFAIKLLGCQGCTVQQIAARILSVGDEPGRFLEGRQCRLPVARIDEALAPRAKIVGTAGGSCDFGQPLGALEPLHDLAQPPVTLRIPVMGASVPLAPRDLVAPLRQEGLEARERLDRHTLHFADRCPETRNPTNLGDRRTNCLGTLVLGRQHVRAHDILRRARVDVATKHLIDELVLTEIDVAVANGGQQRSKDAVGSRVAPTKERRFRTAKVFVHLERLGLTDAHRSQREAQRLSHLFVSDSRW